jgi:hypothetical protein
MCDADNCEFEETFTDGKRLDAAAAAAILSPYPELLAQWKAELYAPLEGCPPGPSDDPMLYSPTYLKAVISEYLWLRDGGDRPNPAVAALCEQIVASRPALAQERRRYLANPWRRAQTAEMLHYRVTTVADYYNPDYLQEKVDYLDRLDDPFDPAAIRERALEAKFAARTPKEADAPYN